MRKPGAAVGSAVIFVVGPGIVVGLIPWLLTGWQVREPLPYWAPIRMLGVMLLLVGLTALIEAFVRFVVEGLGLAAIVGQALLLSPVALWLVVAAFVRWYEEPTLARRFGADYEIYRRAVSVWWPRPRP